MNSPLPIPRLMPRLRTIAAVALAIPLSVGLVTGQGSSRAGASTATGDDVTVLAPARVIERDRGPGQEWDTKECDSTVSPEGLQKAIDTVTAGSVTCIENGVLQGQVDFTRRFSQETTFRALNPYRVELRHSGTVVRFSGARNVTLEGIRARHTHGGSGYVAYVRGSEGRGPAENIVLRNNIFHDSYDNDLLKVHNGARNVLVEGNLLYDQGPGEQHMDINSAEDVTIRRNIMFNTRPAPPGMRPLKHYMVVKGSNPGVGGVLGAKGIIIAENVFLNFHGGVGGGSEAWLAIGNDGKAYHEASDITIAENLFLGNSPFEAYTPLQVMGATDVTFSGNQVLGRLPSRYYGYRIGTKGDNPPNGPVEITGNVYADPTGNIERFGRVDNTPKFQLRGNTYWNGGRSFPGVGGDPQAKMANPGVPTQNDVVLPVWDQGFRSGSRTIAEERGRLIGRYGVPLP